VQTHLVSPSGQRVKAESFRGAQRAWPGYAVLGRSLRTPGKQIRGELVRIA
jgi:hypothetical protein